MVGGTDKDKPGEERRDPAATHGIGQAVGPVATQPKGEQHHRVEGQQRMAQKQDRPDQQGKRETYRLVEEVDQIGVEEIGA